MTERLRLSKRLMQEIDCSRSEAERYILAGFVTVDQDVIDLPQHQVSDEQIIALAHNAKLIDIEDMTLLANAESSELLLDKHNHWPQDSCTETLLSAHLQRQQIYLPLPTGCVGLQVYSQDWRTQRKLEDDAYKIEQEFILSIDNASDFNLNSIKNAPMLTQAKLSWQNEDKIRLAMKKPPQELLGFLQSLGLNIIQAKRIRIGGVSLGKVSSNQWRYLRMSERF